MLVLNKATYLFYSIHMKETQNERNPKTEQFIRIFRAVAVLCITGAIGFFVYGNMINESARFPFRFGLDLAGGSQLTYNADVSKIAEGDIPALMEVLRQVIENRINVFGVSEPNVQVEKSSVVSGTNTHRLIVELPGVTDVDTAIAEIGKTPLLEFKLVDQKALAAQEAVANLSSTSQAQGAGIDNVKVNGETVSDNPFTDTGLTGRYLKSAALEFAGASGGAISNEPIVSIVFDEEGAKLFEKITTENTGENLAIFLDGEIISAPTINEPISGGRAIISGGFTPEEARSLAQNLNFGALPVPIELQSTQTIGGALGEEALKDGVYAGVLGFILIAIFMIVWYRVPGIVAVVALFIYVVLMLALFQLIPVVLTAAGIAGLILSVGLAVDANVLIAERIKEEIKAGKGTQEAISEGFSRAWLAIRDSNIAHIIAAVVLFWFGTSLVKGFALVFGLGVVVSMLSAITISRTLLMALPITASTKVGQFFLSSGFHK
jgi:preprotein translocase subunit SecD